VQHASLLPLILDFVTPFTDQSNCVRITARRISGRLSDPLVAPM
jgi:hypothetical protein